MAYDRYDREHSRWSNERSDDRSGRGWRDEHRSEQRGHGGGRDDRGFWDRASEQVASWFGADEDEGRRLHERESDPRAERMGDGARESRGADRNRERGRGRDVERDRERSSGTWFGSGRAEHDRGHHPDRDENYDRGVFNRGGSSERDYNRGWKGELTGRGDRATDRGSEPHGGRSGYRPVTGDYGRGADHESEQFFGASGYGRGERGLGDYHRESDRSEGPWSRDEYRRTSFAGSRKEDRDFDPHYRNWRDRQVSDLDRDYDEFRREHESKFEQDFTSWREKRQHKRGLLGQVREHMEVVGSDGEHVGTVDKTAGDRIILTKSDPESGGAHHSISCSDVDKVEGDRVVLDCPADDARKRWRDESRSRALFEREDQGEMGPGVLDRSFSGTYR